MLRAPLAVVTATLLATFLLPTLADAAPTSPDNSFSGDGILTIHSDLHDESFADLAVLPNRKTLVLVSTHDDPALELYRLLANGQPDPAFGGGDGVFALAVGGYYENLQLAVDQRSGKSYITTFLDNGTTFPTTVWRVRANGTLDIDYGGGTGHVDIPERLVHDLVALRGGKLVMAGVDFDANTANVWRLRNNGNPDPQFGTGGETIVAADGNTEATGIALQPDGKILVAGDRYDPTDSTLVAYRLTKNGSFDATFSGDGRSVIHPGSPGVTTSTVWTPEVLLRPDGRTVYVAGLNQNDGSFVNTLLVAGLTKSGKRDRRVGKHVYSGITETGGRSALTRDGKLVVTGQISPNPSTHNAVYRITPKGKLDRSWSGDGILRLPGASSIGVGVTPQGRILVGRSVSGTPTDTELRAFRGTQTPRCRGKLATQFGSRRADVITGTSHRDVLVGLGGNDALRGFGGGDLLCGSAGKDRLLGGGGNDELYGQAGNDVLIGGPGRDTLVGGSGNNTYRP